MIGLGSSARSLPRDGLRLKDPRNSRRAVGVRGRGIGFHDQFEKTGFCGRTKFPKTRYLKVGVPEIRPAPTVTALGCQSRPQGPQPCGCCTNDCRAANCCGSRTTPCRLCGRSYGRPCSLAWYIRKRSDHCQVVRGRLSRLWSTQRCNRVGGRWAGCLHMVAN